tara:strand:- start:311 stop:460 length:150 start_codon:yes stop_codon:yes gene_type:complete
MNVSASKKPSAASKSPFGRDGGKSEGVRRKHSNNDQASRARARRQGKHL